MESDFFYKNFMLGQELHIAGGFIYNGLKAFDQLEFFNEAESFDFLYNISIGIERLEKILIILSVSDNNINESFKKNIQTHDHVKLFCIIKQKGVVAYRC